MSFIVGLAWLLVNALGSFVVLWLGLLVGLAGITACLWSIHLVAVQPRQPADEVGMSAQTGALLIAVPVFVAGASAFWFAFVRTA